MKHILFAAAALFLATTAQAEPTTETPAAAPAPAPAKVKWVGAIVIDKKGEEVGPIDRLVPGFSGVNAEIIIRGHRSSVPLKSLTMGDDGRATSTMTKEQIRRTSAEYGT